MSVWKNWTKKLSTIRQSKRKSAVPNFHDVNIVVTFVIVLTKDDPIRKKYMLASDGTELVIEEVIENFTPYSRVIYVQAVSEIDAQRRLFDYMRENGIEDWKDVKDGTYLQFR